MPETWRVASDTTRQQNAASFEGRGHIYHCVLDQVEG